MASQIAKHPEQRPEPGVMRRCRVVEVYDGDTVTLELITPLRLRLIDCWAPEIRTKDDKEKALGNASKLHLQGLAEGKEGHVFIPLQNVDRLDDILTLGRVLGCVWIEDDPESLSQKQVAAELASTTKGGELGE